MTTPAKIKIALIEDDHAIVQMYTMRFGFSDDLEVRVANDGASGLELIENYHPDVILLDMMMPTMSGADMLTRLRSLPNGSRYQVIALTNMKDDDITKRIKGLGVQAYLVKAETPPEQIEAEIRKLATQK
ncbi:MAG: response regulator [Candidatus Saccharimonadales bacterium]